MRCFGNPPQVLHELYVFGFRPNLTRRHEDSRSYIFDEGTGRRHTYTSRESVAIDVGMNSSSLTAIHGFAGIALNSLYFISLAMQAGERVAEYLVAAIAYGKDSRSLIMETLGYLYRRAGNHWNSESVHPLILMVSYAKSVFLVPF